MRKKLTAAVTAAVLTVAGLFGVSKLAVEPQYAVEYDPADAYEIAATQDLAYRNTLPIKDGWSVPKTLDEVFEAMKKQLKEHRGDGFKMRLYPLEWSKTLTLATVLDRLPDRLAGLKVGEVWVVKALIDGFVVKATLVDLNPAMVMKTVGTPAIDIIIGTVITNFGDVPEWGICVCKKIDGTNLWSQHAYCNAVDFGGDLDRLDRVAHFMADLDAKGYVPIAQLLWQVPDHYNHIHFSGDPLYSGWPACA